MLFIAFLLSQFLVSTKAFYIDSFSVHNNLFNEYQRYNNVLNYLKSLRNIFPNKVSILTIGTSSEGREIATIKISSSTKNDHDKPMILIDGGMHAREWMTPAVALYIVFQLVENEMNKYMIENVDWIIIPVLNPDGYEYSHEIDLNWRKTTSKIRSKCRGVDINRNFNISWTEGNNCEEDFGGPMPFSEPETRAFRDLVLKYRNQIKLYLNLHAYGSLIMYPYSYKTEPIINEEEHNSVGLLVANEIEKLRGTKYMVGSTQDMIYKVNGSGCDWMAEVVNIPLNFGIELPSSGGYFRPPSSQILPTGVETFEGIKVFHAYVEEKWGKITKT